MEEILVLNWAVRMILNKNNSLKEGNQMKKKYFIKFEGQTTEYVLQQTEPYDTVENALINGVLNSETRVFTILDETGVVKVAKGD